MVQLHWTFSILLFLKNNAEIILIIWRWAALGYTKNSFLTFSSYPWRMNALLVILTHHFEQSSVERNTSTCRLLPCNQSHKTYKTPVTNCIQKLHTAHTTVLFPQPSILMLHPLATSQVIYMKKSNWPSLKKNTHTKNPDKRKHISQWNNVQSQKLSFFR